MDSHNSSVNLLHRNVLIKELERVSSTMEGAGRTADGTWQNTKVLLENWLRERIEELAVDSN